ncbi:RagB/SusD family nutrient uptake outer membrane protein [Spirosoma endbachense]|uniref:RagB/SusD family nutrient uptake outer membrane protein n=1 Tax=Spirosoma endbachense TaxID=2666025 RepID=A0A6P1W716_9BACT|nr:RagB/SusD family nutrient uptake outer membrane protein [Spirosoma endbachense]QHW00369.1 RagB/SusD family nutrient uptake outer membrane protein [Spirosoma endbachense]
MKKIVSFITILVCCFITTSCNKNFLDKAPGVDLTEDNAFLNKANLETFITTIYRYGVHSNFRYRIQGEAVTTPASYYIPFSGVNTTDCIHPSSSISDEGDASEASFVHSNRWNEGTVLPATIVNLEDFRYYIRWIALRQINLVLKRINEVPDADEAYKKQVIAEVKSLRALNYLEMLKRYGGVPIVDQVYEPGEKAVVPRSSFSDCVKFVVKDIDESVPNLPAVYSASQTGRVTALVALAIKAEVLLYAASPQYNTATPVLPMANAADNALICYGNFDQTRWQVAADAAKVALDYALANGYGLIDDPANRNPKELDNGTVGPLGNYRVSWETTNNKELIFMYQGGANNANGITNIGNAPLTFWNASCFGSFWSGISMPLNFLKKYEKLDGTPQTWDAAGGTDLMAKYAELDPRFKQSVIYTNGYYTARDPIAQIYNGGKDYVNCKGGLWLRKYIPRNATSANFVMNDVLFRVNELYLNYAEALNEAAGPVQAAYDAVNTIRTRSGMPNLPQGLTKEQFRQRVRNEIAIEMLNDDHRFWDVKRWLIAEEEGIMKGNMDGLQITRTGTAPNYKYSWKPYTFETRTFNKNMYLHPFPLTEVLKGNLVQNPGW